MFLDEKGILRCGGRLTNSELGIEAKFPILLPKSDPFTMRVIQETHERYLHCGVSQTLAMVRRKYWICQGRRTISTVLAKCLVCRKAEGKAFDPPQMPSFPKERVESSPAFRIIGLDYFGPLKVRDEAIPRSKTVRKFGSASSIVSQPEQFTWKS